MIDRGDIRQAIDRCSNIWASLPGMVMVSSSIRLTGLIAKFKEAGGTVRDWCMSRSHPRLSPLWLSASSSACHGLANHYRDNAITYKPSATKIPENPKLANAAITDMQMRQRDGTLRSMQNAKVNDAKTENDALRDDVAAGRRQFAHQSSLSVSAWSHRLGVDNYNPDWQTPLNKLFHPQKRLITMQKQLEGTQKYVESSADRGCPYRWATQLMWAIHTRFSGGSKCLK